MSVEGKQFHIVTPFHGEGPVIELPIVRLLREQAGYRSEVIRCKDGVKRRSIQNEAARAMNQYPLEVIDAYERFQKLGTRRAKKTPGNS